MAENIDKLVVQLSADIRLFRKEMAKANGISAKTFRTIENQAKLADKRLEAAFHNTAMTIQKAMGAVAISLGVSELVKMSDEWTRLNNILASASEFTGRSVRSLSSLRKSADDARSGLEPYVELYATLLRSSSGVIKSEADLSAMTEVITKSFVAGGASARDQASAITQLSHSLNEGVLQGQQLLSLEMHAPILFRAIAAQLGTTVAGLKRLGAAGQFTAEMFVKGVSGIGNVVERQFNITQMTISDALVRIKNGLTEFIGTMGKSSASVKSIIQALVFLADNIQLVGTAALGVGTILAIVFAGKKLADAFRGVTFLAKGAMDTVLALRSLATAGALVAVPFGALAAVVGGALVYGLYKSSTASDELATTLESADKILKQLGITGVDTSRKMEESLVKVAKETGTLAEKIKTLQDAYDALNQKQGSFDTHNLESLLSGVMIGALPKETIKIIDDFKNRVSSTAETIEKLNALQDTGYGVTAKWADEIKEIVSRMGEYRDGLAHLGSTTRQADKDFDRFINKITELSDSLVNGGHISASVAMQLTDTIRKVQDGTIAAEKGIEAVKKAAEDNSYIKNLTETMNILEAMALRGRELQAAFTVPVPQNKPMGPLSGENEFKKKKVRPNEYESLVKQTNKKILLLQEELKARQKLNPFISDYGYSIEKEKKFIELINSAKEVGLSVDQKRIETIRQLAELYASSEAQVKKLSETQEKYKKSLQDIKEASHDVTRTFIDGMIEGKSATEALADAISRLGQRLLDSGLDMLFDGLFKSAFGGLKLPASIFQGVGGQSAIPKIQGAMPQIQTPALVRGASAYSGSDRRIRVDVSPSAYFDVRVTEISRQETATGMKEYDKGLNKSIGAKISNARNMNRAGF